MDPAGRRPIVRQIMLIDAPAVLGWQRWRELDEQGPLGEIKAALAYAAETGSIERRHVDAFAHIVLAAANEVALVIARADDPAAALAVGESTSPSSSTACLAIRRRPRFRTLQEGSCTRP